MPNDLRQAADELSRPAAHPLRRTVRGRAVHHQQQRRQLPHSPDGPRRWSWNARGSGAWRLVGCAVTSAFGPGGAPAAATIRVLRLASLTSTGRRRQSWSTSTRSSSWRPRSGGSRCGGRAGRSDRLVGRFAPASFIGIGSARPHRRTAFPFGAEYQSVLTDLEWDAIDDSLVLRALEAAAEASGSAVDQVQCGRIREQRCLRGVHPGSAGRTLGPAEADEPRHLVIGRRLIARLTSSARAHHRAAGQDQLLLGPG